MYKLPIPVPAVVRRDEKVVRRGFWAKMRRFAAHTGFAREATAAYYCTRDSATPMHVKAILLSALAYFVVPTDMIPDFVAGLGFTDDLAVVLAAWRAVGPEIKDTHRAQAEAALTRFARPDETAA